MPAQRMVDRHSLRIIKMENTNSSGLPPNNSNQKLVAEDYLDRSSAQQNGHMHSSAGDLVNSDETVNAVPVRRKMTKREWTTVIVLCFVNLINYMDRYTIAGILDKIQCYYDIDNGSAGLLQTAFVVSYMVFAPVFGYLGDRYNRKYLMAFGVFLWSVTTLMGSFMESFGGFITFRALVGIGEASYSTIAPTIISDMFVDDRRSKMLAFFYFAIPVGSGMGYIVGSETAKLFESWQWGLRVTPVLGAIAVILILFVMSNPERGESENSHLKPTSYQEDIVYLCKNPSFMLSTLGFTCVAFVTGALAWWGPKFVTLGLKLQDHDGEVSMDEYVLLALVIFNIRMETIVSFKFGLITMISGILGVPLGSMVAQKLRERNSRADALVCAFGLLMSTPLLFFASIVARYSTAGCFTLIFFGELFLNLNWSIVADILLYVVIPTRRSTAEAFQILLSHALGDAGSPYIIGQVSEWLKTTMTDSSNSSHFNQTGKLLYPMATVETGCSNSTGLPDDPRIEFDSLQYSLFITSFVEVFGGLFFLITAWYIIEDKLKADKAILGDELMNEGSEPAHFDADEPPSLN